jgi:translation elongation factor EF-Tu-like GTPase
MFTEQIVNLKPKVQTIIDFIAKKDWVNANVYLHDVSNEVEDLIDSVSLDAHLIELGKYQVLLKHLLLKIQNEKN